MCHSLGRIGPFCTQKVALDEVSLSGDIGPADIERRIEETFGEGHGSAPPDPAAVRSLLNFLSPHIERHEQQYAISSADPYEDHRDEFPIGSMLQQILHFDQFFEQVPFLHSCHDRISRLNSC